jgi:hypothetical protein
MSTDDEATIHTDRNDLWPCGRPMGSYRGTFPEGFLSRLHDRIGIDIHNNDVLFPFGGLTPQRDNWHVNDIREGEPTGPNDDPLKADTGHDARDLPTEWVDSWPVVISDPPYGEGYSTDLYGTEYPRPSDHMAEATRVLEPGGTLVILDQLVYNLDWSHDHHPVTREQVATLTTGPGMRARAVNVFRKPERLNQFIGTEDTDE